MKKKIFKDKSVQSETCDFYAHMALTYERHFARCFCRYSGNKKTIKGDRTKRKNADVWNRNKDA